jgi:intein-encoded DNA endonuclease-like protein
VGEIAQALGISGRDVSYWLRVKRPSRTVYNPDLTPRPDLAYLVGAYLGDGRTAGARDKKVRFKVADPAFADLLNGLVAKVLRASPKTVTTEGGFHCVNYDAAMLYDYVQRPLSVQMPLIESFPTMFLRGFFDAEGYVSAMLNHSTRRFVNVVLGVVNTDPEYMCCVQLLLEKLGIPSTFQWTHRSGEAMTIRGRTFFRKSSVRHLRITGKGNAKTFQERVGFSIPTKKEKLADLTWIARCLAPEDGYRWFVSNYEFQNHKWLKKNPNDNNS